MSGLVDARVEAKNESAEGGKISGKKSSLDEATKKAIESYNVDGTFLDPIFLETDDGTQICFSKSILARCSPVFRACLETGSDDPFPVQKTSSCALIKFLHLLDCNTSYDITLSPSYVVDVYPIAYKYEVDSVMKRCTNYVTSAINAGRCPEGCGKWSDERSKEKGTSGSYVCEFCGNKNGQNYHNGYNNGYNNYNNGYNNRNQHQNNKKEERSKKAIPDIVKALMLIEQITENCSLSDEMYEVIRSVALQPDFAFDLLRPQTIRKIWRLSGDTLRSSYFSWEK